LLDPIRRFGGTPPDDVSVIEGVFSVLAEVPVNGSRVRRLPSLYLSTNQLFADRHVELVQQHLVHAVETAIGADDQATYAVTVCEIGGIHGLYAKDMFNRSSFRRRMGRHGMRFAATPFMTVFDDGTVASDGWENFIPAFAIVAGDPDEGAQGVSAARGAQVSFFFARLRLGLPAPDELRALTQLFARIPVVLSGSPDGLATFLRRL
jgi:hypothetical protein